MEIFEDKDRILEILRCPDIWGLVTNGVDADPNDFKLPADWLYLTETGNEVFVLSTSLQIHANIMPETRHKAYWMCKKFIRWIKANTDLPHIYLQIHKKHQNAIQLGKLCGFKEMEFKNDRYLLINRF